MEKYYGLFSALNAKTKEEDEIDPIVHNPDWSSPSKEICFFKWNKDKWETVTPNILKCEKLRSSKARNTQQQL